MTFEPRQKNKVPEATILALFLTAGVALAFSAIEGVAGGGVLQSLALVLFGAMIFITVRYKFTSFRYTVKLSAVQKKSLHHDDDEDGEEEEEVPLTPDGKEPPVTAYPPKRLMLTVERRQGRGAWTTECIVRLSEIRACFILPEDKAEADATLKAEKRAPRYKYFRNLVAPDQTVMLADTPSGRTVIYLETDRKMCEYLKSVASYNSGK